MYPQAVDIKKVGKQIKEDGGYLDDAIVKLSSDGRILFEKSVSEIAWCSTATCKENEKVI